LETRTIIAVVSMAVVVIASGVIFVRERRRQRRLTERVARAVAATLQGSLVRSGHECRIEAVCAGRPVVVMLAGKFMAHSDSGPDFVPSLEIKVPCSSSARLTIRDKLSGITDYLRDMRARARGSKLQTGAADFDAKFNVEGPVPSEVAILDERIRKRILLSQSGAHGNSISGHSWSIRLGDGAVEGHEIFNEGPREPEEAEVTAATLARVALLCALAASAERHAPA
jgi:hypothetical protein